LLCSGAAGALIFAAGSLLMPSPAFANYTSDCSTLGGTTVGGVTVYAGPGGRTGTAAAAVGVCVQNGTGTTSPPAGGDAEVGVNPTTGVFYNPTATGCPATTATAPLPGCATALPAPVSPGVYAVADGSDTNPAPNGVSQGVGYIGVSN